MSIEAHPVLHYLILLVMYMAGVSVNILIAAYLSVRSASSGFQSITHYLRVRWVPVGLRFFVSLCLFLLVWGNSRVFNTLETYASSFTEHLGAAGFLGLAFDTMFDKAMVLLFPGVQKELPPLTPLTEEEKKP